MIQKFIGLLLICLGLWLGFYTSDYSYECNNYSLGSYEKFNSDYSHLNSISKLQKHIDSIYDSKYKSFDSFQYFRTTIEEVKQKFYHGNAAFDWKENWIAYVLGKFYWSHINSLVSPNEVAKHCSAMCSQQSMVFSRLMSLKGYTYRYVYLKNTNGSIGHFCCDIWLGGDWHFVDVNQEPKWENIKGKPNQNIEDLKEKNKIEDIYRNSIDVMQKIESKNLDISYSQINEKLGGKMMLFQFITKWLSYILPILIGGILIWKSRY